MAFDPSEVGVDGRRPFRPPALAENEPRFEIGPVKVAQLFDGQRLVTELLFFCRTVTARNPAKLRFCFEPGRLRGPHARSEEHTSELQSLMRISYAVFCLKKQTNNPKYQLLYTQTH